MYAYANSIRMNLFDCLLKDELVLMLDGFSIGCLPAITQSFDNCTPYPTDVVRERKILILLQRHRHTVAVPHSLLCIDPAAYCYVCA
jgi:hypothetical protein